MQYKIHNAKSIDEKDQRQKAKKIIQKQFERLQNIEGNYPKSLYASLYLNKSDRVNYVVSCTIKMKEGMVFVKEKGDHMETVLHTMFDKLKVALNNKINKERKAHLRKSRNKRDLIFQEFLPELQELKETDTQETFNQLLKMVLGDVAKYIKRRIKSAEMTTAIKKGKFKKQEILDDVFLYVYDRLDDVPEEPDNTKIWLYGIADTIMEQRFREIEFERENIERIAGIVEKEYAGLEEKFTVDAEEEIIPVEEIDEYESLADLSMATLLYGEDEDSILDDITLKINKREIRSLLEKELARLPLFERTVMDHYLINQLSVHEIAQIKKAAVPDIESIITRISWDLRKTLERLL
jgi:DNA-directed RNA polymerase specialized sigma24 family protein